MIAHDIVVIGGSAGSIAPLKEILAALPADLAAAVFVVVHIPGGRRSMLPYVLSRSCRLPVKAAEDCDPICSGRVYVAPPDYHMILEGDCVRLISGPKENHCRPSVDALFRSAAAACDGRVIAIVLSGNLSDGSVGLAAVKARHGVAIVQSPTDAEACSMPLSAIAAVRPDYVVPVAAVGELISTLVADPTADLAASVPIAVGATAADPPPRETGLITCPDCGAIMRSDDVTGVLRYMCSVGHAYDADGLLMRQTEMIEDLLWTAVRALDDQARVAGELDRAVAAASDPTYADTQCMAVARSAAIRTMLAEAPAAC